MWIAVNKVVTKYLDTDHGFPNATVVTKKFAIRARCIYCIEQNNDNYFTITMNDGTDVLCKGKFRDALAAILEEDDDAR